MRQQCCVLTEVFLLAYPEEARAKESQEFWAEGLFRHWKSSPGTFVDLSVVDI